MFHLPFSRKSEDSEDWGPAVDEIPLLALLAPSEKKFVGEKLRLVEYRKGDRVYRQGENPDAFYMVAAGRFRVLTEEEHHRRTVTCLFRGDYFGEISLLTGKPHSVTVEAMNDSRVFRLDKEDFSELLRRAPSFSLHLSRLLGLRLRDGADEEMVETKIVSIVNAGTDGAGSLFSVDFSLALRHETKQEVFFLDTTFSCGRGKALLGNDAEIPLLKMDSLGDLSHPDVMRHVCESPSGVKVLRLEIGGTENPSGKKEVVLLSHLLRQAGFILTDFGGELNEGGYKLLSQSDEIYLLVGSEGDGVGKCRSLLTQLKQLYGFPESKIKTVFIGNRTTVPAFEKELGHRFFSVLPKPGEEGVRTPPCRYRDEKTPYCRVIRYLTRELSGRLVGLVLGSGAAHGLAHAGVLKALEAEGIPIDVIAGSSIGSLMGGLWAAGYSAHEIEKITLSLGEKAGFFNVFSVMDLSPVYRGFLRGNQTVRFLRSLLGNKTFQDLRIPLKVVATNLFTSEAIVFEEGDLVEAIRASIAIPGIFRCGHVNGNTCIDGGVVDPLPVKLLADRGVRKIIAVNVLPGPEDVLERKRFVEKKRAQFEKKMESANFFQKWIYRVRRVFRHHMRENIFNVLMNTIQYMGYQIARHSMREADIVIHPILPSAHWAEFYSPGKFIRMGEERTRELLPEIRKLIDQPRH
ncbi:MAG TPA: patatin-like phospholipase family protein [Candidatus Omnitrophota bacterium]|mgnify:CR=1 FL=1|nr:patatin-like phospholipase family protein [Candidatus Omnitrophota bacterium]